MIAARSGGCEAMARKMARGGDGGKRATNKSHCGALPRHPSPRPKQRAMIADLRRAVATDNVYLDQRRQAHAEALSLMQDLCGAAGEIVPVVQHHIGLLGAFR